MNKLINNLDILRIYWVVIQKYLPHEKWLKKIRNYYAESFITNISNKYYFIICDEIDYAYGSNDDDDANCKHVKLDYLKKPYKLSIIEKFEKKLGNRLPEDFRQYLLNISREILLSNKYENLFKNNFIGTKSIELSYKNVSIYEDYENYENIDITDNNKHLKILHISDIYDINNKKTINRYYIIINSNEFYGQILHIRYSKAITGKFEKEGEYIGKRVNPDWKDEIVTFTDFINEFVIE